MKDATKQHINLEFESPDQLINELAELEIDNRSNHFRNNRELINALDNSIYKFHILAFALVEEDNLEKKILFHAKGFMSSVSNNSLVIRNLFVSGFHIQVQTIMRTQFEFLNNLLSFLHDRSFFNRFSEPYDGEDLEKIITPRQVHTEKLIAKFLTEKTKKKELWLALKKIMTYFLN